MPRKMREHLEQAKRSHSTVVANQRTDPHHLIPDGTKYVFQRADPNDPIVSQLQRCRHFSSVNHLLNEVDDILDVLKELDPDQVETEQALDMEEDGSETQESSSVEPPSSTTHVGEQKGVKLINAFTIRSWLLGTKPIHLNHKEWAMLLVSTQLAASMPTWRAFRNLRRARLHRSLNRHLRMRQAHLAYLAQRLVHI